MTPFSYLFSRLTLQMFSLQKNGKVIGWSCWKIRLKSLKNHTAYLYFPSLTSFFQDNLFLSSRLTLRMFSLYLFLYQPTHNMTTDCSLNYEFSTWKFQAQNMFCTQIVFCFCFDIQNNWCTQHACDMFWAWNFHVLNS